MRRHSGFSSGSLVAAALLALAGTQGVALGRPNAETPSKEPKTTRRAEKDAAEIAKAQRKRDRKAAKRAALLQNALQTRPKDN